MARAQSSHAAIGVAATILSAPPAPLASLVSVDVDASGHGLLRLAPSPASAGLTATTFIRVTRDGEEKGGRVFVAPTRTRGVETVLRLPAAASDTGLRLERLIVAGT